MRKRGFIGSFKQKIPGHQAWLVLVEELNDMARNLPLFALLLSVLALHL